jgi:hypothetical protein
MHETVGVVASRRAVRASWRLLSTTASARPGTGTSTSTSTSTLLLRVLRERIVPKVAVASISIVRLLRTPHLLLTLRIRIYWLREGRGRGGKLSCILAGAVLALLIIVVSIEAEVELQPVGLL